LFCIITALAIQYSGKEMRFTGTFNPQGSVEAYKAKLAEFSSMTCECKNQAVPLKLYTTTNLNMTSSCEWFKKDIEKYESDPFTSACKAWGQLSYCTTVNMACNQSDTILNWVNTTLKNKVIYSTQLMAEESLSKALDNEFTALYQIASVISSAPHDAVGSWAAANMPKVHKMLGGITNRLRALTVKQLHDLHDDTRDDFDYTTGAGSLIPGSSEWVAFKTKCEAARPLYCESMWTTDPDGALEGDKKKCPLDLPSPDSALKCDAEKVGDGKCNRECLSEACFFDGGDCVGKDLLPDPYGDGQTESAFSTSDAFLRAGKFTVNTSPEGDLHWLDTPDDYYLNSTKRRCDSPEFWLRIGRLPLEDDSPYTYFSGFDWALRYTSWFTDNGETAPSSTFRASRMLGCDAYNKDMKQNYFDFYSPNEMETFVSEYTTGMQNIRDGGSLNTAEIEEIQAAIDELNQAKDFLVSGTAPMTEYFDNLETAIKYLFVDWETSDVNLDYAKYFKECAPTTCTFVYDDTPSSAALIAIVFGLIGGITTTLDAILAFIYKVCRRTILGPPTGDATPTSEGDTNTHKKTAQAAPSSGNAEEIGVV
jgi:hypothetical protein|tara:strand:+ start:622 stop:2400 length:1779 start_codon:yes stop_codon:yes gene_type:complete